MTDNPTHRRACLASGFDAVRRRPAAALPRPLPPRRARSARRFAGSFHSAGGRYPQGWAAARSPRARTRPFDPRRCSGGADVRRCRRALARLSDRRDRRHARRASRRAATRDAAARRPALGEITTEHGIRLVASLSDAGARRGTIRKTLMYARAVLDEADIEPNPLRDKRVRLPHEEDEEIVPPEAEHVRPSTARSRRCIACRSSGSTGAARASPPSTSCSSATTTSRARASGSARRSEDATRPLGRPAGRARRGALGLARSARGSRPGRTAIPASGADALRTSIGRPEARSASRRSRRTTSGTGASASCIGKAGRSPRSSRSSDTASSRSPPTSTRTSSSTDARSTCPRSSPHEGPADRTRPPDRAYPRGGSGQPRHEPARVRAARPARPTADPPRPLEARTAARARTLAHDAAERTLPN